MLAAILVLAGCGSRNIQKNTSEDMVDNGRIGYTDIVSFIVQGYQCRWDGITDGEGYFL